MNGTEEPGTWRLELVPGAPRESDIFLNVMEVGEAESCARFDFRPVENGVFCGAVSPELAILFTADSSADRLTDTLLTLPGKFEPGCKVVVAGLSGNGIYRLAGCGEEAKVLSAGSGGVVEFTAGKSVANPVTLKLEE